MIFIQESKRMNKLQKSKQLVVKNLTQILPCLIWKILWHTGNKRKTDQVTENKQENKEKKGERERDKRIKELSGETLVKKNSIFLKIMFKSFIIKIVGLWTVKTCLFFFFLIWLCELWGQGSHCREGWVDWIYEETGRSLSVSNTPNNSLQTQSLSHPTWAFRIT